jgi:ABC-2 type transport system permease protein
MSPLRSISMIPEISRVTVRQLLGRRRTLLLVLLSLLPALLAVILRLAGDTGVDQFTKQVFATVSLTILLPLVAILFGCGAFGAEIDDGTIVYLLAKPVPRWVMIAAKGLSAFLLAVILTGASTAVAGYIAMSPAGDAGMSAILAQVLSMVVGSACYVALFMAVSLYTRRALVIGIGYMLVWEGALSLLLPGIANLSIRQYALGASAAISQLPLEGEHLAADTAFLLAGVLVVAALVIATLRLQRFEMAGETD